MIRHIKNPVKPTIVFITVHVLSGIELDVENRLIELLVSEEELKRRKENWVAPEFTDFNKGYKWLYRQHVLQADKGCDFDFTFPMKK